MTVGYSLFYYVFTLGCDLYRVRTKGSQTIVISPEKKNLLQKGPETEKKFGLGWD